MRHMPTILDESRTNLTLLEQESQRINLDILPYRDGGDTITSVVT